MNVDSDQNSKESIILNEGFLDFKQWLKRYFSKYEIPGGTESSAYKDFEKFVNDLRGKGYDDGDVLQFLKGVIKKVPSTQNTEKKSEESDSRKSDTLSTDDDVTDELDHSKKTITKDDSSDDDDLDDLEGDIQDAIYVVLKDVHPGKAKKKLINVASKISAKFVGIFVGIKLKRATKPGNVKNFLTDEFPKITKGQSKIAFAISKTVKEHLGIENKPAVEMEKTQQATDKPVGESAKERYRNYLTLLESDESIAEGLWGKLGAMLGGSYNVAGAEKNPHYKGMIEFIKDLKSNYDEAEVLEFLKVMLKKLPKIEKKVDNADSKKLDTQKKLSDQEKKDLKNKVASKVSLTDEETNKKFMKAIDSGDAEAIKRVESETGIKLERFVRIQTNNSNSDVLLERWNRLAGLI